MPWPVGQRILRENDLPRGHGWEKTVERLSDPEADYSDKVSAIAEALEEHLLCGEKLVRFFRATLKAKAEIAQAIRAAKIEKNNAFAKAYPLLLSENELEAQNAAPTLIAVKDAEVGVCAVFCSVRSQFLRETLSKEDLPEEVLDALADYDESWVLNTFDIKRSISCRCRPKVPT
jgi:hypothetical protein